MNSTYVMAQVVSHYHANDEPHEGVIDKVNALLKKGQKLLNGAPHQAKKMARKAMRVSRRNGYKPGMAKAHGLVGQALMAQAVHERALDHF